MGRKEIELEAERLLEPALKQLGIELIDVEYVRERNWILRVFIDKEDGVDLNDCIKFDFFIYFLCDCFLAPKTYDSAYYQ